MRDTDDDLKDLHRQWLGGRTKCDIEVREWNDLKSHGKRFTSLVRDRLGIETEDVHPMRRRIQYLEALLDEQGIEYAQA